MALNLKMIIRSLCFAALALAAHVLNPAQAFVWEAKAPSGHTVYVVAASPTYPLTMQPASRRFVYELLQYKPALVSANCVLFGSNEKALVQLPKLQPWVDEETAVLLKRLLPDAKAEQIGQIESHGALRALELWQQRTRSLLPVSASSPGETSTSASASLSTMTKPAQANRTVMGLDRQASFVSLMMKNPPRCLEYANERTVLWNKAVDAQAQRVLIRAMMQEQQESTLTQQQALLEALRDNQLERITQSAASNALANTVRAQVLNRIGQPLHNTWLELLDGLVKKENWPTNQPILLMVDLENALTSNNVLDAMRASGYQVNALPTPIPTLLAQLTTKDSKFKKPILSDQEYRMMMLTAVMFGGAPVDPSKPLASGDAGYAQTGRFGQ